MRYPEFLKPGGRIGFIAPSFGCTIEPYKSCFGAAVNRFRSGGFETVNGPNCFLDDGIGKSTDPKSCAEEINDFFINDRCDCIISCGGGETMCEDLPYVDFEGISKAKPKWFLGYSDNTNLTFTLPTLCDIAAVYGPCASSFGAKELHPALSDCLSLLKGEKLSMTNYDGWEREALKEEDNPFAPYNITEPFDMKIVSPSGKDGASFSGRLIGGCLDCLSILCGTGFDRAREFAAKYADDGIIWFIESCDLNPMGIRRALWQLDNAGWFENVKGFLIGRPLHTGEEMMGMDCYNAVTGVLEKYSAPILLDIDLGHLPPAMPLISGAMADVTAGRGSLEVSMRLE